VGLRSDIDFRRNVLTVERSSWHGIIGTPKSGRSRQVELTERLAKAFKAVRHMRGDRVLYEGNEPVTDTVLHRWMASAPRRAGLKVTGGGLHILRHSFCSHLAMQGAPARAIQELAGHADLTTTMRYMHLSPSSRRDAIRLLDRRPKHVEENDVEAGPAPVSAVETLRRQGGVAAENTTNTGA
jgi:integrase